MTVRMFRYGAVETILSTNSYAKGRASKTPTPPRIAVLPLWNGSQAKPMRGSKFLRVAFLVKKVLRSRGVGSPATEAALPACGHIELPPCGVNAGPQGSCV